MAQRYCKVCGDWHDLDEPWPVACMRRQGGTSSIQIIKDIEPYQAVASDVASGGNAPRIGSRRRHREFLKDNNYVERGNEPIRERKVDYDTVKPQEVRRVFEQLRDRR